jgi:YggT family protein
MIIVKEFLFILIQLLGVYSVILLIRALVSWLPILVSWLPIDPYNPIVRILYALTEPLLEPIRALLPRMGGLDLSPLVAWFLIFALQWALGKMAAGL